MAKVSAKMMSSRMSKMKDDKIIIKILVDNHNLCNLKKGLKLQNILCFLNK